MIRQAKKGGKYQCDICGQTYPALRYIRIHINRHQAEKKKHNQHNQDAISFEEGFLDPETVIEEEYLEEALQAPNESQEEEGSNKKEPKIIELKNGKVCN